MKKCILYILISFLLFSCSKNDNATAGSIEGTWVFTNQITFSNPYPGILNYTDPPAYSAWKVTGDSIRIRFDGKGHYTFSNYRLPADNGSYSIVRDSLLVIEPDTSGFVKFNYTLPTTVFGTGTNTNQPLPYAGFHFTSDTIQFKKDGNKITFAATWLSKADHPSVPGGDTLILNEVINYFTKK